MFDKRITHIAVIVSPIDFAARAKPTWKITDTNFQMAPRIITKFPIQENIELLQQEKVENAKTDVTCWAVAWAKSADKSLSERSYTEYNLRKAVKNYEQTVKDLDNIIA